MRRFVVLVSLVVAASTAGAQQVYNGRAGQLQVAPPRIAAAVAIDGQLSEAPWAQAAVLTGFSMYQPVDQQPAQDSTVVLVWYSPTAIHFGIRAFAPAGAINANLSDRDKITADDAVDIILNTFNDGRQAFVFGVSALGVQADGTINEGARGAGQRGGGSLDGSASTVQADLSANFVYESKGRITDFGYEVEVRIPFKSLRYQALDVQDWGVQVVRRVRYLGHDNTWTPARRDAASFLAQAGTLKGLHGLERGLVVDFNPSVVGFQNGAPRRDSSWRYLPQGPEYGGTMRWGVTNNLVMNGTFNPDFSQVEADVVALVFDPRQALFYPERRPFFLEGIENYSAPDGLIYTRRMVQPDFAAKLTGKVAGTNVAVLSGLDDRRNSLSGDGHPYFNVLRAVRDVGPLSRIGLTYTDRLDADDYNRVLGVDGRLVFRKLWTLQGHGALSRTRLDDEVTTAPLWSGSLGRNGRTYDFNASINAVGEEFDAQAGFISRRNVANYLVSHAFTFLRAPGSRVESWGFSVRGQGTQTYTSFVNGRASQDRKLHFNGNMAVRGGWRMSGGIFFENFGFDSLLYQDHYIERTIGGQKQIVKFTGAGDPRLHNVDLTFRVNTPEWSRFSGDVFYIGGKDENFDEWQSGLIHIFTVNARWRPTDLLRLEAQYQQQEYNRWKTGETVNIRKVPRLKMEYQATRFMFVRFVGQYDTQEKLDLRDDQRTNDPLLLKNADGTYTRLSGFKRNRVRADWLFSYQPTPGTVLFVGYGSSMSETEPLKFRALRRTSDGFFVKWSYLFRL
ncbi:MAG: carbohydrate binding family 9 domain-containing protein [Gemmatimonadetes bacterium]|nr:carbohydrate binding family 9 domain-containing protein [Gemmatimonadota bacterium]